MIETLQVVDLSRTHEVTFRWQGMIICLVSMHNCAGKKCLRGIVESVADADGTPIGQMGKWITLWEDSAHKDAGADTISSGSALNAIERSMGGLSEDTSHEL